MKRLLASLTAVCLLALPVMADTLIAPNLTASGTLTASNGTFSGSITFTNTSSVSQGLVAFSLQLFGGNTTISSVSFGGLTSGWNSYTGKQSNNGSPCNEVNNPNWICADGFSSGGALPFTMGILSVGTTMYTFSGTYDSGTAVTLLDLMANGCSTTGFTIDNQSTVNCDATKWAYSNSIGTGGVPFSTPEPASLEMIGCGLVAMAGVFRRRLRR